MNCTPQKLTIQPVKRGMLARKLLQAANRQARSALPELPMIDEGIQKQPGTVTKVLGPYPNGGKWRLVVKEGAQRKSLVCDTEQEALSVRAQLLGVFDDRASKTIGEVIVEYLAYKRRTGCVERSISAISCKLVGFLPVEKTVNSITTQIAERLYSAQTERVAVATHHGNLKCAKAFFAYCIKQKYVPNNPFANVQRVGKARAGKPQLRQDEARRLSDYLVKEASNGELPALALLVQVILGLRSGEVLNLRKRDLDCHATVVVVDGTKNKNARRNLELHAPMVRELLLQRCSSLGPDSFIFAPDGATAPRKTPGLWKCLGRYCKRAGVPPVCPHSLRGLHSTLAVKAGATSSFVAQALGHGSDAVTRKHYILPSALDSARSARVADALLGQASLDSLIATLRGLPSEQLDLVCAAVGLRR